MPLKKVVITGVGAVSPWGVGVVRLMEGLRSGRSAVVNLRSEWEPQVKDLTCWIGAPVGEPLDPKQVPRTYRRSMGRVAFLAYLAAKEALERSGIPRAVHGLKTRATFGAGRMGVSFASTMGSISSLAKFFAAFQRGEMRGLPAGIFFQSMSHTCAANLAHAFGINGRLLSPNSACASSLQAIGAGFEMIRDGAQDCMLCGGAEELHVAVSASFDLAQASSHHFNDQPTRTPRPFDRDRDGTVCGEGAGAVILESEEGALARGARILAEVIGYATTVDSTHMAQPHSESIIACLNNALGAAGLPPDAIDYVNAHATGTLQGDQAEAEALRAVFGAGNVPVSGLKGYFGHTLGASGALELIACLGMQQGGYLLPTLNLEEPGKGCEGLDHVMAERPTCFERFAKNNFAFGGVNTVLILKRYADDGTDDRRENS
ncbi:MAG: beta-ketoacyl-[acyl-carrier-protein] synthase family protein [Phycisphaerae bacterium]